MKKFYNKLVRDNIPKIIQNDNKACKVEVLSDAEYLCALKEKLVEESKEARAAINKEDISVELADILEVIDAIKDVVGIRNDELEELKIEKANLNGKFENRYFLEYVIEGNKHE